MVVVHVKESFCFLALQLQPPGQHHDLATKLLMSDVLHSEPFAWLWFAMVLTARASRGLLCDGCVFACWYKQLSVQELNHLAEVDAREEWYRPHHQ